MAEATISREELGRRVVYALLRPAAQVALSHEVPLAELKKLVETAVYHETQRRGMSMRQAMSALGVSISKAALLSKQLKQAFLEAESAHALPRQIEYMLWAGPLTFGRINQALSNVDEGAVQAAIDELIASDAIEEQPGEGPHSAPVFVLKTRQVRRVWNNWLARLDGLDNALQSVAKAAWTRFFAPDDPAFARTVTLHVRRADLPRLDSFYEQQLFPLLAELDNDAEGAEDDVETVTLSLFWALSDALPSRGDS